MLREFLSSLPPQFSSDGMDVFRAGLPSQLTHCNAFLYQEAHGLLEAATEPPSRRLHHAAPTDPAGGSR